MSVMSNVLLAIGLPPLIETRETVLLSDSQVHPDTLAIHHDNSVIAISSTLSNYAIVHTTGR